MWRPCGMSLELHGMLLNDSTPEVQSEDARASFLGSLFPPEISYSCGQIDAGEHIPTPQDRPWVEHAEEQEALCGIPRIGLRKGPSFSGTPWSHRHSLKGAFPVTESPSQGHTPRDTLMYRNPSVTGHAHSQNHPHPQDCLLSQGHLHRLPHTHLHLLSHPNMHCHI